MPMGNTGDHGPALVRYLDGRRAEYRSVREFALAHGIDPYQVSKWRAGAAPSIEQCRRVADALGDLTLGQVLVIAGYGEPNDFHVVDGPPPLPVPLPSVPDAIERDRTLGDHERVLLDHVWQGILAARAGRPTRRRTLPA